MIFSSKGQIQNQKVFRVQITFKEVLDSGWVVQTGPNYGSTQNFELLLSWLAARIIILNLFNVLFLPYVMINK